MLQIMAYDIPYIEKSPTKNIHTTISLYGLAEVIVEGIYHNFIKSKHGKFYFSTNDAKVGTYSVITKHLLSSLWYNMYHSELSR